MDFILNLGLTNALTAAGLALTAAVIARFTRQPALWYALWLVVLLRLLAPPLLAVDLPIPELGETVEPAAAAVAVSGGGISLADSGLSLDPRTVIFMVWAAGAMVVIGFAIAQSFHLRQLLVSSSPAASGISSRVVDLSRRLGLRRAPPTVQVEDRVPPMLWAFLGSVRLILPTELLQRLDDDETDTLLAHELAHLSRRDHWVRHLELAALAVFWWNPVAWWATRRVRRAQELCCDGKVAELLPDHRRAYADTLVETARYLSGRRLPLGSPARAMADLNQLKGRIRMIMSIDQHRCLSLPARLTAAAVLLAVLAVTPVLTATQGESDFTGRPISLNLKDADLLDVLATFSEVSAVEILVEPGVSGSVTTTIHEVPWDEALASIIEAQGLTWQHVGDQIIVRRAGGEGFVPLQPIDGEPSALLAGRLDGEEVFRYVPDGRISEPVVIERTPPKYPPEARKEGVSGVVVADLVIDEIGMVRDVLIEESPSDQLSAAAIDALEQWRFQPAMMDGQPVAVRYIVTIKFRLQ
jgi:TonB family protein